MKILILLMMMTFSLVAFAQGDRVGGGGDDLEMRVDEIRMDIIKWINDGGSRHLILPAGITLAEYNEKMLGVLVARKVIIGFVADDSSPDEELRVQVDGQPKTCRGFRSRKDNKLHILCNIHRFKATSESGLYKLIHHEYAGLAGLERNDGPASDYEISNQIPSFLEVKIVRRLSARLGSSEAGGSVYRELKSRFENADNLSDSDFNNQELHFGVCAGEKMSDDQVKTYTMVLKKEELTYGPGLKRFIYRIGINSTNADENSFRNYSQFQISGEWGSAYGTVRWLFSPISVSTEGDWNFDTAIDIPFARSFDRHWNWAYAFTYRTGVIRKSASRGEYIVLLSLYEGRNSTVCNFWTSRLIDQR